MSSTKTHVNYLVSGSIAGAVSRSATAGFERLTIIQQVQGMAASGTQYVGCINALKEMVKKEGPLSIFKGNGANVLKVSPNTGIRFLTYEFCKKHFTNGDPTKKLSGTQTMFSGAMAGLTSTFFTYPLDVIRIRLSLQGLNNGLGTYRYKGVGHGMIRIYKEEGVRGLYKGLGTAILSVAPWVSLSFASYEGLKHVCHKKFDDQPIVGPSPSSSSSPTTLINSTPSISTTTTTTTNPNKSNLELISLNNTINNSIINNQRANNNSSSLLINKEKKKGKDMLIDFLCGAMSGGVTMTACYPLDVLRRRMMVQGIAGSKPLYSNGVQAFKSIIKNEGVPALYHGIVPAYFKVVPTVAISFAVYELFSTADDKPTPTFPKIDLTNPYTTYVSFNDYQHGYTFAAKEFFNPQLNRSVFESRNLTIIDWGSGMEYWYSAHYINTSDTNIPCVTFPFDSKSVFVPSYKIINNGVDQSTLPVYLKTEIIDRGINCNIFQSKANQTKPSSVVSEANFTAINYTVFSEHYPNTTYPNCQPIPDDEKNQTTPIGLFCTFDRTNNKATCTIIVSAEKNHSCNLESVTFDKLQSSNFSTGSIVTKNATDTYNINTNFYFDAQSNLPVRMIISGDGTTSDPALNKINTFIDWIDWVSTPTQQTSKYRVPTNCKVLTPSEVPRFDPPTLKNLSDPLQNLSPSSFEPSFSALFEQMLEGSPQESIMWRYDIDYQAVELDTQKGELITVFNDTNSSNFTVNTYSLKCTDGSVHPFLSSIRTSIVYNLLVQKMYTSWKFVTRTTRRGIDTDVYNTISTLHPNYSVNITLYLFAPGWTFPGRYGVELSTIMPLAIETIVTPNGEAAKHDIWDIFVYTPEKIPKTYMTKDDMHCIPDLPNQYSAIVSVNYGSSGSSSSFVENYDEKYGAYYTEGKFNSFSTRGLLNLTSNMYSLWNSSFCSSYNVSELPTNTHSSINPSLFFLTQQETMGPMEFYGEAIVRSMRTKVWKSEIINQNRTTADGRQIVQNSTYYFHWLPPSIDSVQLFTPVRVSVTQSGTDLLKNKTFLYETFVDWSFFLPGKQDPKIFQTAPSTCNVSTAHPAPFFYIEREYSPPPLTPSTPHPVLPTNFTTYLEIKVTRPNGQQKLTLVKWQFSMDRGGEAVTIIQGNQTDTYGYCYSKEMGGVANYSVNGIVNGFVGPRSSPLFKMGADSLIKYFYDPLYISKSIMELNYTNYRGVPTQTWDISTSAGNTTYSRWYPSGWIFFGVEMNQAAKATTPITMMSNNTQYGLEIWDIFRFSPGIIDDEKLFANCTGNFVKKSKSGLPTIAIAAIIIIIAIFTIGSAIFIISLLRGRKQLYKKNDPPHILLEDRNNLINQNEVNRQYEN
eukprot:gene6157-7669_t